MSITIISTSNAEKPWVDSVSQDYAKRLQAPWDLTFIAIEAQNGKKDTTLSVY